MSFKQVASDTLHCLRIGLASLAMFQFTVGASLAGAVPVPAPAPAQEASSAPATTSPIKHVIVIIGENRSFDHVFATYRAKDNQTVWNLLSEKIINADGTPGPNFRAAQQSAATDKGTTASDAFLLSPPKSEFPGNVLPAPLVGGAKDSYIEGDNLQLAEASENGLPADYYQYLISGGTGLTSHTPDTRITDVNSLPAGPFQLTNGNLFTYNSYAASPVHRFYQMWQQLNCSPADATRSNPSGCDSKLFSWVEVTEGAGANGVAQPPICVPGKVTATCFTTEYLPSPAVTTGEGSTALGFYNVQQGDVPYFKHLADNYAMSDNFHQSVNGGTGANHIMLGHGDLIWFSDGHGHAKVPPHNVEVAGGTANAGIVDEVENPKPAIGTNNWYTEDGYGGGSYGSPSYGGGSYSNCADPTQPGTAAVVKYLQSLPHPVDPHCEVGHYYLLNNYNPGYFGNGNNAFTDTNPDNTVFTIPPSSVPSIGDDLNTKDISWKYYGDQWDNYVPDPYQLNYGAIGSGTDEYCNICNPFQYDTQVMANTEARTTHMKDTIDLYNDIKNGTLPAVSFVKPSGLVDGHPSSSKLNLFEGFTKKIVDAVKNNPKLWYDTAIFITFDEGGGYYDSGYVQPLDFFGDGTRIPLIVVSAYNRPGYISHEYTDHVSILKFIERNWRLKPVSYRSRDNFPNPITARDNPYVPLNGPAIGDLFDLFTFGSSR
ncbi:MAG: alkaline phosphatase family protein [Candidatus Acidiferrales bacterium]